MECAIDQSRPSQWANHWFKCAPWNVQPECCFFESSQTVQWSTLQSVEYVSHFFLGARRLEDSLRHGLLAWGSHRPWPQAQAWGFVHCSAKLCPTICNPMNCSVPGFPVLHYLLELAQTRVHWVSDAIQPTHPLLSPFPHVLNLSQHQTPFQWVGSLHQVVKVLELQHQSFQWIFRVDFL